MLNVTRIDSQEYIGNSLNTITNNFALIENKLCTLQYGASSVSTVNMLLTAVDQSFDAIDFSISSTLKSTLCQIRMSLDPTTPVVYDNFVDQNVIYIHPYNGNIISLYNTDTSEWQEYFIDEPISFFLTTDGTQYGVSLAGNVVYDVFIYVQDNKFQLKYAQRPHVDLYAELSESVETRYNLEGVVVSYYDDTMRYIGSIYTSGNNNVEQTTNIKTTIQSIWNKYNQHEAVVSFQDQCDFVVGEPTNIRIYQTYYLNTDNTVELQLNSKVIDKQDIYTNSDCTNSTVFDLSLKAGVYSLTKSSLYELDPSYITNITLTYLS